MPDENPKRQLLTLDQVSRTAKETTLKAGYHVPTLMIEGDLRSIISQIQQLANTFEGRETQMFMHGFLLANVGDIGVLQQVFFISEGWMSVGSKETPPQMPPSRDPQRKEVLIIAHHHVQPVKNTGVMFEMRRNVKGKLIGLPPLRVPETQRDLDFRSPLLEAFVLGFLGNAQRPDD